MPQLTSHPDFPCAAAIGIEAEATRPDPGLLMLRHVLTGAVSDLRLPPQATSARADELWRHTCFEAFVAAGDGYYEFNVSPSTQWAAYRFDGYREGMRPVDMPPPQIEVRRETGRFELRARLHLDGFGLDVLDWRVGLSAVVECADNSLSYWALAHPPGKPDFHNADCFALELPGSGRP